MDSNDPVPAGNLSSRPVDEIARYHGQVTYLFAYDIAYELVKAPTHLLGQKLERFTVGPSKPAPRGGFFYRPMMVSLPPIQRTGPHGRVTLQRTVKLFDVGAITISVRVPFDVRRGEDLVSYHELQFEGESLHDHVQNLAQEIRKELEPYLVRPVGQLKTEEAYTVFCIAAPLGTVDGQPMSAEQWFLQRRRQVAALLTQEQNPNLLSAQEATDSTGLYLSYYDSDLTVIDWDAAILVDQPDNFEEVLHIMDLANVQLAELEAYDSLLDEALSGAYLDINRRSLLTRRKRLSGLREIRVDLTRMSDELSNTTKFFGDWHLARIYQLLSSRFHLAQWQLVVVEKLKTLDSLYQILKQDQTNFLMMVLEITIVLLFIIDLLLLVKPIH